jgi:hypothetical protein
MTDFLLDESNDLAIGTDFILTGDQANAVKQLIMIELRTILGEWFLDQSKGLPYFSSVLGKNPNKHYLATLFKNALLALPQIKQVQSLEVNIISATRTAAVSFVVELHNGEALSVDQLEAPIV